jgi:UDP-glucuronate 4-epimerase
MHPMQQGDVTETYADVSAIAADLGYAPRTSLDAGIPKFVEWFRRYTGL